MKTRDACGTHRRLTIERWASSQMIDAAFTGFAALPAPGGMSRRACWDGFDASPNAAPKDIQAAYRRKATTAHPDTGGSDAAITALNIARSEALSTGMLP